MTMHVRHPASDRMFVPRRLLRIDGSSSRESRGPERVVDPAGAANSSRSALRKCFKRRASPWSHTVRSEIPPAMSRANRPPPPDDLSPNILVSWAEATQFLSPAYPASNPVASHHGAQSAPQPAATRSQTSQQAGPRPSFPALGTSADYSGTPSAHSSTDRRTARLVCRII